MNRAPFALATLGLSLVLAACGSGPEPAASLPEAAPAPSAPAAEAAAAEAAPTAARKVEIAVTEKGYEPDRITVAKGEPVELVFTRKTETTCAKEVILNLGGGQKVEKPLPLDQPVTIAATFQEAGDLHFGCAMGMMIKGTVTVQ